MKVFFEQYQILICNPRPWFKANNQRAIEVIVAQAPEVVEVQFRYESEEQIEAFTTQAEDIAAKLNKNFSGFSVSDGIAVGFIQ